ncbi:MAG: adenosylcobinamide-GDP ribazoletransferase [Ignisphaera sp.]|uniref:Adenosylcobinamide-GDP ribazoletransferase n=1 Tax=Ignisphaera aggregans TaxID=334771 RepID=A0A7J3JRV3_9CREN
MKWKSVFKGLKSLLALLTTIPTGNSSIEYAAQYFYLIPVIGLVEGAIVSFLIWSLYVLGIHNAIISILYIFFHLMVTGGIHFDGYADYSDVIGSHRTGEYAIKILKDPRRGTFSIISITLNLLISSASMYIMLGSGSSVYASLLRLVVIYVASAEAMYITAFFGIEEPYNGLGRRFVISAKISANFIKNIITLLAIYLSILVFTHIEVFMLISAILITLLVAVTIVSDAKKRLGFINGDIIGFSYETTRVVCMVIATCV